MMAVSFPHRCSVATKPQVSFSRNRRRSSFICSSTVHDKQRGISAVDMMNILDTVQRIVPRTFDDPRLVLTLYDHNLRFNDPMVCIDSLHMFWLYIETMKHLCQSHVQLHYVKQTGPFEITIRWTTSMKFMLIPWKPELVLTGTSIMGINPHNQKFSSHVDLWDSVNDNSYFSLQGLWDIIKQLQFYETSDLESPRYQILKRTTDYEVRKYSPYIVVETEGNKLTGSKGFDDVLGFILGKNSSMEKMAMTTPVFTHAIDAELSKVSKQIVLPLERELKSLPNPNKTQLKLRRVEGCIVAVSKIRGTLTEDIVRAKEGILRSSLVRDALKPKEGCSLARYNNPSHTWSFIMRNEVLIWLEDFILE